MFQINVSHLRRVHLFVYLFVCFICLFVCFFVCLFVFHMTMFQINVFHLRRVHLFVCLLFCLLVCFPHDNVPDQCLSSQEGSSVSPPSPFAGSPPELTKIPKKHL